MELLGSGAPGGSRRPLAGGGKRVLAVRREGEAGGDASAGEAAGGNGRRVVRRVQAGGDLDVRALAADVFVVWARAVADSSGGGSSSTGGAGAHGRIRQMIDNAVVHAPDGGWRIRVDISEALISYMQQMAPFIRGVMPRPPCSYGGDDEHIPVPPFAVGPADPTVPVLAAGASVASFAEAQGLGDALPGVGQLQQHQEAVGADAAQADVPPHAPVLLEEGHGDGVGDAVVPDAIGVLHDPVAQLQAVDAVNGVEAVLDGYPEVQPPLPQPPVQNPPVNLFAVQFVNHGYGGPLGNATVDGIAVPPLNVNDIDVLVRHGCPFMKAFRGPFVGTGIRIPAGFRAANEQHMHPVCRIRGEAGLAFEALCNVVDGRLLLHGVGWSNFMAAEKVVSADVGFFVLYAPHSIAMYLFRSNGDPKPMALRPVQWNAQDAQGFMVAEHVNPLAAVPGEGDVNGGEPNAGGDGAVQNVGHADVNGGPDNLNADVEDGQPEEEDIDGQVENGMAPAPGLAPGIEMNVHELLDMSLVCAHGVHYSALLMQTFMEVWINNIITYPMYAVRLLPVHINKGAFYLNTEMSNAFIGNVNKDVVFYFRDGVLPVDCRLWKRDGLVRFSARGWRDAVQLFGLQLNQVLILAMTDFFDTVVVRVFPLGG